MVDMQLLGQQAKQAARNMRVFNTADKNRAILAIADKLAECTDAILAANAVDLEAGQRKGMTSALLDRLNLNGRMAALIADVRKVADLPDTVGKVFDVRVLENGLRVERRRVPIGVLGVIYESRPNVTID